MHPYWGATLHHPSDLPVSMLPSSIELAGDEFDTLDGVTDRWSRDSFSRLRLPAVMTDFRKVHMSSPPASCACPVLINHVKWHHC